MKKLLLQINRLLSVMSKETTGQLTLFGVSTKKIDEQPLSKPVLPIPEKKKLLTMVMD